MININMTGITESANQSKIKAGIYKGTFLGIEKHTRESQNGKSYTGLNVKFDLETFGIYEYFLFTPDFNDERDNSRRSTSTYSFPSNVEQYMLKLLQIVQAVNPEVGEKIVKGEAKLAGKNFNELVSVVKNFTDSGIGTNVEVKLVPNYKGDYVEFPNVGGINRNGDLQIINKFIGKNLTLTDKEVTAIANVQAAAPTTMKSKPTNDVVGSMATDFNMNSESDDDDLPF